jgi:hypothetical protein
LLVDELARFPMDALFLVLYGPNTNEFIQIFNMNGFTEADDGTSPSRPLRSLVHACPHIDAYGEVVNACTSVGFVGGTWGVGGGGKTTGPSVCEHCGRAHWLPSSNGPLPFFGAVACLGGRADYAYDTSVYDFTPAAIVVYNQRTAALGLAGQVLAADSATATYGSLTPGATFIQLGIADPLIAGSARRDLTIVYFGEAPSHRFPPPLPLPLPPSCLAPFCGSFCPSPLAHPRPPRHPSSIARRDLLRPTRRLLGRISWRPCALPCRGCLRWEPGVHWGRRLTGTVLWGPEGGHNLVPCVVGCPVGFWHGADAAGAPSSRPRRYNTEH